MFFVLFFFFCVFFFCVLNPLHLFSMPARFTSSFTVCVNKDKLNIYVSCKSKIWFFKERCEPVLLMVTQEWRGYECKRLRRGGWRLGCGVNTQWWWRGDCPGCKVTLWVSLRDGVEEDGLRWQQNYLDSLDQRGPRWESGEPYPAVQHEHGVKRTIWTGLYSRLVRTHELRRHKEKELACPFRGICTDVWRGEEAAQEVDMLWLRVVNKKLLGPDGFLPCSKTSRQDGTFVVWCNYAFTFDLSFSSPSSVFHLSHSIWRKMKEAHCFVLPI